MFLTTQLVTVLISIAALGQSVPSSVGGAWKVERWSAPGISGMRDGVADSWVGRLARFDEKLVEFGPERCEAPSYRPRTVEAENYFIEGFRIYAKELGITATTVSIVEILCRGKQWDAPSNLLIIKDKDHLLTVWDGVFFELTRPKSA
jgi:hypothetical protein